MRPKNRFLCFFAGLCGATLAAGLGGPTHAQTVGTQSDPWGLPGAAGPSRAGRPGAPERTPAPYDPFDQSAADNLVPAISRNDPSEDPEAVDNALDPGSPSSQGPVVQDGNLDQDGAPTVVYDGLDEQQEGERSLNGPDPTLMDTRTKEERAVFESPPAGHDPLLFQIEDIDPVVDDRLPRRLAKFEPYDPVGIRLGSFVYFPRLEASGNATNNVLRAPDAASDTYAELRTEQRLVSNWSTHALEFRALGLLNFHDAFSEEDDRAWGLEGRGRLDVTRQTNIQGNILHDVHQEQRTDIDAATTGDRPDVTTDRAAVSLNHRFNRLSIQLRGSRTDLDYADTGTGTTLVLNDDRNSTTHDEALRTTWEFKPTFALFAETEWDQRTFDAPAQSDLIRRDSDGERWRFGIDFGNTSRIVRGEASIGWGRQKPDDPRLTDVDAVLFDANLAWRMSDLTSLLLTAETNFYDTNTAGSPMVVSHTAGVELRHAFRRYLIGTAGVSISARDYAAIPLEETDFRTSIGTEYYISREYILFGRYEHIAYDSNAPQSNYHADDIRLGLRWRR